MLLVDTRVTQNLLRADTLSADGPVPHHPFAEQVRGLGPRKPEGDQDQMTGSGMVHAGGGETRMLGEGGGLDEEGGRMDRMERLLQGIVARLGGIEQTLRMSLSLSVCVSVCLCVCVSVSVSVSVFLALSLARARARALSLSYYCLSPQNWTSPATFLFRLILLALRHPLPLTSPSF